MVLLRRLLGDALRRTRQRQQRTLREVSSAARVSLGYLSEVERGQKEPSSELLAAICDALEVELSDVLREISATLDAGSAAGPAGELSAGASARVVVEPVVIERSSLPAKPVEQRPALDPVAALSHGLPSLPGLPAVPAVPAVPPAARHAAECRAPVTVAA
ncbi:MAG: helix-turn-helix domain-containing protein [Frankiaceae bacterium]